MSKSSSKPFAKSVLYLSYDGLTDPIGRSQVLPYLLACRNEGIKFHVVTFEKKKNAIQIAQTQALLDSVHIPWHRLQFTEGRSLLLKLYDFCRFVLYAIFVAVRYQCRVIHSRSYFASIIGLIIKWLTGKKLIFDTRDFWIDAGLETGRIVLKKRSHRIVHTILRGFEKRMFRQADHIICLTEAARNVILTRFPPRTANMITVIPCCADLKHYDRARITDREMQALKEKYRLNGGPVFGYVGSIGTAYMLPEYFDCFQTILKTLPDARLLFMANNDAEEIFQIAAAKGVSREKVTVTHATREQMPLHISLIDYGFFFIMPSFAKKACSPTKQYEMLAMGKPIITNQGVGDAEKVFQALECGFLVKSFSPESYAEAAAWAAAHPPKEAQYDLSQYSLDYGAEKYCHIYRSLLNGKG